MDRLKNIVVGIDFSRFSETAFKQAIRIAKTNQAKLHAIHVIHADVVDDLEQTLKVTRDELHDEVRAAALEHLREFAAGTVSDGVDVELNVVIGVPIAEILRHTREVSADLLVLGVRGASERSTAPGATATKCVRASGSRVLLVRGDHPEPFKRVMVCVDFSDTSKRAVEQAVRILVQDKARLDVVHTFAAPWRVLHYMAPTRQASPDYQTQYRQNLDDRLRGMLKPFESETSGMDVECHLVEGTDPVADIIEFQKTSGADLLVLGTRGRTTLKRLLLGTIAENIVRESTCSLLAVKPAGFEYRVE
ncbi:MAG: universal stress protein [Phycisphaerae bacterium]|nr:universal stress protein [Phycisphaerae bacterium]